MSESLSDCLTVTQAAREAKVSLATMYEIIRERRIAFYCIPAKAGCKGKLLIRPSDLAAFLASCRVERHPLLG